MKPPTWLAAPLYLWALLNTLIGLGLALWGGPISWKWYHGALVIQVKRITGGEWVQGQTHGCVVLVKRSTGRVSRWLLVHEFVHVKQQLVLGPLFYPLYGGMYLGHRARGLNHRDAYRAIWFEKVAYQVQAGFEAGKRLGAWGS